MNTEDKKYKKGKEISTIRADLSICKYTCVNDAVFKNDFLSPEVKGIIVEHLSMSDTWQFRINYLEDKYGYGSATAAKISNTLHAFGYLYLHRSPAGADGGWIETRKFYANPYDNPHNRFDFNFKTNKKEPKFLYKGAYNPDGSLTEPFKLWYTENIITPYLNSKPKPKTKYVTKHTTPYTTYDNAVSSQTEATGNQAVSFNGEPRAETLTRAVSFNWEDTQMKDISNTNCDNVSQVTLSNMDTNTKEGFSRPFRGASSPSQGEENLEPGDGNYCLNSLSGFITVHACTIPLCFYSLEFLQLLNTYSLESLQAATLGNKAEHFYLPLKDGSSIKLFPKGLPERFRNLIPYGEIPF